MHSHYLDSPVKVFMHISLQCVNVSKTILCLYDTPVRERKVTQCISEQENGENIFPNVFQRIGNWLEAFEFSEVINGTMGTIAFVWICAQPIHFRF